MPDSLGVDHLSVNTMGGKLTSPDGHIQRLREVMDAIGMG